MTRKSNAFLASLSESSFGAFAGDLTSVQLSLADCVQQAGQPAEWVYFPISSLLSMISTNESGQSVETSMAGNEGAAGLIEIFGSQVGGADCVVQVDGQAWRASSSTCLQMAAHHPDFVSQAWKAMELQLLEARQSAFCQAMHTVDQRFARWMLETFDRCGGRNPLPMTQEFLAAMLGVQRTTVSTYATALQKRGLISYQRGQLKILKMDALEAASCECRSVSQGHRAKLAFRTSKVASYGKDLKLDLGSANLVFGE